MPKLEPIANVISIPSRQPKNAAKPSSTASPTNLAQARKWLAAEATASVNTLMSAPAPVLAAIPSLITELEAQSQPADPKIYAVLMEPLILFAQTFGLPVSDLKSAASFYRETLKDLPPDLLTQAIDMTTRTHRFHVLPKPAEIRSHVEGELRTRRNQYRAAQEMLRRLT